MVAKSSTYALYCQTKTHITPGLSRVNSTGHVQVSQVIFCPNLSSIGYYESSGFSSYNGLQMSFQRRYSKGLTVGANYVWSHTIDDVTSLSNKGQEGLGIKPLDPQECSRPVPLPLSEVPVRLGELNAQSDVLQYIVEMISFGLRVGLGPRFAVGELSQERSLGWGAI